ncbi:cytochrome P450 [Saccharothrix longispora]|uniref:Cytochrome P450 n=1 Tax=Saccharothrix longispora TaxID=33920 RepID=A0ABU1PSR1_9PSEU|nr:cytochrome P450 [Saccharothrix longispora]MDR6593685.1 cytochrome P450 [Saccharothrix longispora]
MAVSPQGSSLVTARGGVPVVGHLPRLVRDPLGFVQSLRPQGDVVRVRLGTKSVYVVNHPDLIQQLFMTDARHFDKGRFFEKLRAMTGNGIGNSKGDFHLRQRRLMQPAFHRQRISGYVDLMREQMEALTSQWEDGRSVSVNGQMLDTAYTVVTKAMFASDVAVGAVDVVRETMPVLMAGVAVRTLSPTDLVERLPLRSNRDFDRANRRLHDMIDQVIAHYRTHGRAGDDLLSTLMAARDERTNEAMTDQQVHDELMTIMIAGTETIASVLAWMVYEVARRPEVQQRVHAELDGSIGGRPVTASDLNGLVYCRQVATEALRRHNPAWLLTRRCTTSTTLGGHGFPAGTEFLISPTTMHRDPGLYPRPYAFDPDRWAADRVGSISRNAYMPFGAGVHKCIGEAFVQTELMVALATIMGGWRLRPASPDAVREVVRATTRPSEIVLIPTVRVRGGGS